MNAYYELYDYNYNNDDILNEIDKKLNEKYKLNLKQVYFLDGNINNHNENNITLRTKHYDRRKRIK